MSRSNSLDHGGRPALDSPARMEPRSSNRNGAGSSTGIKRRPYYAAVPRVAAMSGWKATFMSV